jgi:hypothetical protein
MASAAQTLPMPHRAFDGGSMFTATGKMMTTPRSSHQTFEVSVITFREGDGWTALALEMDLRGYGPTVEAANDDLREMLTAQVSFAVEMGHPESVWNRAADEYWRMFEEVRREQFVAEVSGTQPTTDRIAGMVPLSLLALKHRKEWNAACAQVMNGN